MTAMRPSGQPFRLIAGLTACLALAACARPQPPAGRASSGTPVTGSAKGPRYFSFEPRGAPAASYVADDDQVSRRPLARQIMQRFPGVTVTPCLERAASAFAQADPAAFDQLPLDFSEFLLHWAGCPDATATVSILWSDDDAGDPPLEDLAQCLTGDVTHVGVARAHTVSPHRWCWVVFGVERLFRLRPFPTTAIPGGSLPMDVRLDARLDSAKVVVSWPGERPREIRVPFAVDWAAVQVPLSWEVGTQWVELVGFRGRGPEVLALFPVELGRPPAIRWSGEARPDESAIAGPDEAEALVESLVARERERFALPPLKLDRQLSKVARSTSLEMAGAGELRHVTAASGSVVNRLRASGYGFRFAAENLARSTHLTDAHESLMRSPAHRAAILSRTATRLGVGVTMTEDSSGKRLFQLTELFVLPTGGP